MRLYNKEEKKNLEAIAYNFFDAKSSFGVDFSLLPLTMAVVAQLVRALDCGSKCRGFESRRSPIVLYP